MGTAEIIEGIFQAHISEITDINTVRIYEPDLVDRKNMPLVTMFFMLPEGREVETGVGEEVSYAWEISLYVAMTSFEKAQRQMRDIATQIVANFRQHRNDYNSYPDRDFLVRSFRRRVPPTPEEDNAHLRASWEMTITAGEA